MTALLLAEELFLLTHREESGRGRAVTALDSGYAGALLLELAADGLVEVVDGRLRALPGAPAHPLLAAAHRELAESARVRRPDYWVTRLPRPLRPLGDRLGASLVERGVLRRQRGRRLLVLPTTTWPEADPAPERELRRRLLAVLVDGAEPEPRLALLIALLAPLGLVRGVVPREARRGAEQRAREIARRSPEAAGVSVAVAHAVQAVQAAVVAVAVTPAITSTGS